MSFIKLRFSHFSFEKQEEMTNCPLFIMSLLFSPKLFKLLIIILPNVRRILRDGISCVGLSTLDVYTIKQEWGHSRSINRKLDCSYA